MKPILVGWVERSGRTLVRSDRETHRRAGELMGFARAQPICVRRAGEEDEEQEKLKPLVAVLRDRSPPGKGVARQPEASLAGAATTPFVKRRQRVLKLRVAPISAVVEALAVWVAGAAPSRPRWQGRV